MQLHTSDKFKVTLSNFRKSHYKKDKKSLQKFDALIETFKRDVLDNKEIGSPLAMPQGLSLPGCILRKYKFKAPGLSGGSRYGRIIYIECDTSAKNEVPFIVLTWLYSHEEFEKQPPPKELTKVLKQSMDELG